MILPKLILLFGVLFLGLSNLQCCSGDAGSRDGRVRYQSPSPVPYSQSQNIPFSCVYPMLGCLAPHIAHLLKEGLWEVKLGILGKLGILKGPRSYPPQYYAPPPPQMEPRQRS